MNTYEELFIMLGQKMKVPSYLWPKLGMAWLGAAIALNVMREKNLLSESEVEIWPRILEEIERLMDSLKLVEDLDAWDKELKQGRLLHGAGEEEGEQ